MTKKDFIVIANIIKLLPKNLRHPVTLIFSEKLKAAYPNFDPITFQAYIQKEE